MPEGSGFREREHTADWDLEVWAPSLEELFKQAARGMFVLSGARIRPEPRQERDLNLDAVDYESLLVLFLQELLFYSEVEGLAFDDYHLQIAPYHLDGKISGAPLDRIDKEIKAVTYHNLNIEHSPNGLSVRIVFDV